VVCARARSQFHTLVPLSTLERSLALSVLTWVPFSVHFAAGVCQFGLTQILEPYPPPETSRLQNTLCAEMTLVVAAVIQHSAWPCDAGSCVAAAGAGAWSCTQHPV
jgi:hypothetical protein